MIRRKPKIRLSCLAQLYTRILLSPPFGSRCRLSSFLRAVSCCSKDWLALWGSLILWWWCCSLQCSRWRIVRPSSSLSKDSFGSRMSILAIRRFLIGVRFWQFQVPMQRSCICLFWHPTWRSILLILLKIVWFHETGTHLLWIPPLLFNPSSLTLP